MRRPARTCVLPVPHVPDGLTIAPIHQDQQKHRGTEAIMPDKGKVERPFRYVREDFFLARSFRSLDDLNAQFRQWLDQVANQWVHATTGRVVRAVTSRKRSRFGPCSVPSFVTSVTT